MEKVDVDGEYDREAALRQDREAALRQDREAALRQDREAALRQDREAALRQDREAALRQDIEAALRQDREAALRKDRDREAALRQDKEEALRQPREAALRQFVSQGRDSTVQNREAGSEGLGMSVQDREAVSQGPEMSVQNREAVSQGPEMSVQNREAVSQGPEMSVQNKEAVSQRPEMSVQNREAVSQGPGVTVQDREAVSQGPGVTVQDREAVSQGPEMSVQNREAVSQGPKMSVQDREAVSQGPGVTVQDREAVSQGPGVTVLAIVAALKQAVSQGRYRTLLDIEAALRQAVVSQGRDLIVQDREAVSQGPNMSVQDREADVLQAVRDLSDFTLDVHYHGTSRQARDAVFLLATQQRRWDCAGKIVYLGVSPEKRDCVFTDVLEGDVWLCSNLIIAGLNPVLWERVLRRAVKQDRVSFLVELLGLTAALTSVSAFVLKTAVSLRNWTLVLEVVKMHENLRLSADLLDAACRAAVSGQQWDCALFLVILGVRPPQEMVDAILRPGSNALLKRFLATVPRGVMPSAVKSMLIKDAIEVDRSDTLRDLLRRYGASETETKEAFGHAVSCRNEEALRVLVGCVSRNSSLLKQICEDKAYLPDIVEWICQALKGRHIVLSLDIALASGIPNFLEKVVLCDETSRKVRRMLLQKLCGDFDSQDLFIDIANKLVDRYPRYRRTLFLMSVRHDCGSIALSLHGPGVSLTDVKYALSVAEEDSEYYDFDEIASLVWDYIAKLNRNDGSKLMKWLVRANLSYFVSKGEREVEFLTWFEQYCDRREAETQFVSGVFRRAYKAAVRWGTEDCFVASIGYVMEFSKKERSRLAASLYGIGTQAYNEYVSVEDISKAVAAVDFALRMREFSFVSETILAEYSDDLITYVLKRAFRKRAWPVFEMLFERQQPGSYDYSPYGQVFIHCLSRTVVQASDTVVVKASATMRGSETMTPGASDTVIVGASDTVTVGGSATTTVGASDTMTVGTSYTMIAWASDATTVGASDTMTVGASYTMTVGASDTITVGASDTMTVGPSDTMTVRASDTMTVGASDTMTVGASDTVTVGASDTVIVSASKTGAVRMLNRWLLCMCPHRGTGFEFFETLGLELRLCERSDSLLHLAEFSSRHACRGLALFLALMLGVDGRELMKRVLASHRKTVGRTLTLELACYAVQTLKNPADAAVLIKTLPLSVSSSPQEHADREKELLRLADLDQTSRRKLIAALRRKRAHRWVLVLQLVNEDFPEAEQTLTLCHRDAHRQECVDVVVQYAARSSRSDIVCRHASAACKPDFLEWLLREELSGRRDGDAGVARCLLNLVGTSRGVRQYRCSYLSDVCGMLPYSPQRTGVLARCLVEQGASAQHRLAESGNNMNNNYCPLRKASLCRRLDLLKLFHRSGVCSNRRLFQLAEASSGSSLGFMYHTRSDADVVDQAIIQSYLTFAARSPLSLQDLCRHAVSSGLGGRPGYLQRVRALLLPEPLKDFILFSDLVEEL